VALTIALNLDVYPCARLRLKLGDLRSKSLRDVWGNCGEIVLRGFSFSRWEEVGVFWCYPAVFDCVYCEIC